MNPGPIEETGKVATGVIDALKSQPMVLGMLVFNFVLLLVVYFGINNMREHQAKVLERIFEHTDRLYNCGKQQGCCENDAQSSRLHTDTPQHLSKNST